MIKKLFLLLLLLLIAFVAYQWLTFPDVRELATANPTTTAFMERRRAQLRDKGQSGEIEYQFVPYGRISPYLRRAVLVAEDDAFYDHEGVDVEGIKDALRKNWESGNVKRGGSTITQQLAKNLYLYPTRSPLRKIKEYFIARALERELTKKRILELYLNVVEFGERVYGAEAAARHYFDKPASALNPSQSALLAGALPNPRVMNPNKPNKRLRYRQKMILSRMRRWGYLAEREVLTERKKKPVDVETVTTTDTANITDTITTTDATITESDLGTDTVSETSTSEQPVTSTETIEPDAGSTSEPLPDSAPTEETSPPPPSLN